MLRGGEFGNSGGGAAATLGPRPIHHADVLVGVVDAVNVEETRRDERAGARPGGGRTFAEQLNLQTAFFLRLAQRGLLRVFVQFDVSAERQPFIELAMMNQQNLCLLYTSPSPRDG